MPCALRVIAARSLATCSTKRNGANRPAMALPAWLRDSTDAVGCIDIAIYVQPGAKATEVSGEHDGALKLRINAPPVDGKANAAVIAFLAERCGVSKSKVTLLSGDTHRRKRLRVAGVNAENVVQQLLR